MSLSNETKGSFGDVTPQENADLLGNTDGAVVEFKETPSDFNLKIWLFRDSKQNYDVEISKALVNTYPDPDKVVSLLRNSMSNHLKVSLDNQNAVDFLAIGGVSVYNKHQIPSQRPEVKHP